MALICEVERGGLYCKRTPALPRERPRERDLDLGRGERDLGERRGERDLDESGGNVGAIDGEDSFDDGSYESVRLRCEDRDSIDKFIGE